MSSSSKALVFGILVEVRNPEDIIEVNFPSVNRLVFFGHRATSKLVLNDVIWWICNSTNWYHLAGLLDGKHTWLLGGSPLYIVYPSPESFHCIVSYL